MLDGIQSEKIILIADDAIETKTVQQKEKTAKSLERLCQKGEFSQTAGLEDLIEIKTGVKIMLLRNLDVSSGLVYGAIGTIKKIHQTSSVRYDKEIKSVTKLTVNFDGRDHESKPVESKSL